MGQDFQNNVFREAITNIGFSTTSTGEEVKNPVVKEHRLKIDPGSQVTGLAILEGNRVVFAAELTHRGLD